MSGHLLVMARMVPKGSDKRKTRFFNYLPRKSDDRTADRGRLTAECGELPFQLVEEAYTSSGGEEEWAG
jgi:hypothetical protein